MASLDLLDAQLGAAGGGCEARWRAVFFSDLHYSSELASMLQWQQPHVLHHHPSTIAALVPGLSTPAVAHFQNILGLMGAEPCK